MSQSCRRLLSTSSILVAALCVLALPILANAKTTSSSSTSSTTTVAANSTTTATTSAAPASTTSAPAPAASTTTTTATTPTPAPSGGGPIRTKLIDVDDVATSGLSKGTIDVYMSLTDKGNLDDALVGAETALSDKVTLVTVTNKKETEAPAIHVDLPTGKAVKLADGDKFLRISGIEKSLKDGDHFQLMLHFRSAPNVNVDVVTHKKSSWF